MVLVMPLFILTTLKQISRLSYKVEIIIPYEFEPETNANGFLRSSPTLTKRCDFKSFNTGGQNRCETSYKFK